MGKQKMIVPGYARNEVMKQLIEDDGLLFGKEVLSLSAYKSSLLYEETDVQAEKAELFQDIESQIASDNIYREQLKFPAFFDYFYDFANLLAENGISVKQLPDTDKDRKEILAYLLESDLIAKKLKQAFDEVKDASECLICDYFYKDLSERKQLDQLVSKGGRHIKKTERYETEFECRLANNSVQEIIAIAQYLISEKENKDFKLDDYVLMVNDRDNYLPIIRRIFDNCNLPYSFTYRKANASALDFLSLLRLIRKQDISSFMNAYNRKVFKEHDYVLNEYVEEFQLDYDQLLDFEMTAEKLLNDEEKRLYVENSVGLRKIRELDERQKRCQKIIEKIRGTLASAEFVKLKNSSLKEQCSYAYEYLFNNDEERNSEKVKELSELKQCILSIVKRESSNDERLFELLAYELERMSIEAEENCEGGLMICDPFQNAPGKSKAIIAGCTQQNYPISVALDGFFDEAYLEQVEGFDSLIERNGYFEKEYDDLLHQFKKVIFSAPIGSVDGDKYELSTLVSEYVKDKKSWNLYIADHYQQPKEEISEDLAKKIYLQDDTLNVSPSSLGTFVSCPFKYYIEKGLQIKEEPLAIEANTLGSINHSLLERMFKNELEDIDDIAKALEPYFAVLKSIMFNDQEYIENMKKRLALALGRSFSFLKKFKESDDHDYYPEDKINYRFNTEETDIKVRGSIDRLDIEGNRYRIIDYKSSEKEVKIDDVKKGINFQLLSYLVFYYLEQQENGKELKDPELFAYFSMKNSTLKKTDADKNFELSDKQIRENDTRYLTYLVNDGKADERFFAAAKADKGNDPLSFARLKEITLGLFENISRMIMSGDIGIRPSNNACRFCKYQNICHHSSDDTIAKSDMPYIYKEQGDSDETE